jgi:NAD(P)H-dependent FMN reductase
MFIAAKYPSKTRRQFFADGRSRYGNYTVGGVVNLHISCFLNGEDTCPHASFTKPIIEAMAGADLIILTSPVYAMDVSGQMKALLDHLCFMWMSHRPDLRMFDKVGVTVSTTAGAGLGHAAKTLKNCLVFLGVKRVFPFNSRYRPQSGARLPKKERSK